MLDPIQYQWKQSLFNFIATLWRLHEYDYDDVQMQTDGPLDANVTGQRMVMLDFRAHCKYCDKEIPVNRVSFRKPPMRQRLFCHRDLLIYQDWKERQKERAKELDATPALIIEEASHADDHQFK